MVSKTRQKESPRFFQTTLKTIQKESLRFFQITSKTKQKKSSKFLSKISQKSARFFQTTSKTRHKESQRSLQIISKPRHKKFKESLKLFQTMCFKNQIPIVIHEILLNYFKKQTQGVPEILSNRFKNRH